MYKEEEMPEPEELHLNKKNYIEVKRIASPSGKWITIIAERKDSNFAYFTYHWDLSEYEFIEEGYWNEYDNGSIFDSMETALPNALEDLKCKSGEI
jgi:hypothetical protein